MNPSLASPPRVLLAAIATAAYLTTRLFVFPWTPVLLGGDQGFFWMYADRIQHGSLPYRDFFQFTPPGADLAYLIAFAVFGTRIWVTNAVVIALGAGLGALSFRIANGVMSAAASTLATGVFVVFVYGQALTGTHHWWSMLFVLGAVVAMEDGSLAKRSAFVGVLLGLAAFCTQTHGVAALVAFVAFVLVRSEGRSTATRERVRRVLVLVLAFGLTVLVTWAYFVAEVGVGPVASCVITYAWHHAGSSAPGFGLGLPDGLTLASLPWLAPYLLVYALVPTGLGLSLVRVRRKPPELAKNASDRVTLLSLLGLALAVEVSFGLSWVRLFAVALPGILLAARALDQTRSRPRRRALIGAVWLATLGVALLLVRSTERHHPSVLALAGGRAATTSSYAEELSWLAAHLPAGGGLFASDRPNLYLPLGLHNPLFLDAAIPSEQTTVESARRAARDLDASELAWVVWSAPADTPPVEGQNPADGANGLEGVRVLRKYLRDRYHLVRSFEGGDEAWLRN